MQMNNSTSKSSSSVKNQDTENFPEDENDSDVEGRLYAEIYYSNELYETEENFEYSNMKTIDDIKKATQNSLQNSPVVVLTNEVKSLGSPSSSAEKKNLTKYGADLELTERGIQIPSQADKHLVSQNQLNLHTELVNSVHVNKSNEIVITTLNQRDEADICLNLQLVEGEPQKRQHLEMTNEETNNSSLASSGSGQKHKIPAQKNNLEESVPILNDSLTIPISRKRPSEIEAVSSIGNKKRSLEPDNNANNHTIENASGNPDKDRLVIGNGKNAWIEANLPPLLSEDSMKLLFRSNTARNPKKDKQKTKKCKSQKGSRRRQKEKKAKAQRKEYDKLVNKSKTLNEYRETISVNPEQSENQESTERMEEIIEINTSDSSRDDSDENISCKNTLGDEKIQEIREKELQILSYSEESSNSDGSIFEVPVPPKPPPPLIELHDSEKDSSDSDNTSSDGIYDLMSSYVKKKKRTPIIIPNSTTDNPDVSPDENSVRSSRKNSKENFRENYLSNSVNECRTPIPSVSHSNSEGESSDSSCVDFYVDDRIDDNIDDDLLLNCTNVQKGASSLEEIKKIRKVAVAEVEKNKEDNITRNEDEQVVERNKEADDFMSLNETVTKYTESVLPLNNTYDKNVEHENSRVRAQEDESDFAVAGPSTSRINEISTGGQMRKKKSSRTPKNVKKYKTSREKSDEEYFFEPMSDELKAFYNNSWGGEECSLQEIQKQMPRDPRRWAILDVDWKPSLIKRQRYFLSKMKCTLCRQEGHLRANCPEPKKRPVCHMCGAQGHYETRCPQKFCLTCGIRQNTYMPTCESCSKLVCTLCNSRGHRKDLCPDLWRQYHHTTSEAEHQPPTNLDVVMKPSNLLICCNCSMRGHDSSRCSKYRWSQHYPTPPFVTNYYKSMQFIPRSSSYDPIEAMNVEGTFSGSSYRDLNSSVEPENNSSQSLIGHNLTVSDSEKSQNVKIIFQAEISNLPRYKTYVNNERKKQHSFTIVLNDIKGAVLEGLIAGRITPNFLAHLSRILICDIEITLVGETQVNMHVIYYTVHAHKTILKKIINHWVRLSDEDKDQIIYRIIRRNKEQLIKLLSEKFEELDKLSGNVKSLYKSVKHIQHKLERKEIKSNKSLRKCKRNLDSKIHKLVMLLYRNNCAVTEKMAVSNLLKIFTKLQKEQSVSLKTFSFIFYYFNLIFSIYVPPDLQKMVGNYSTSKRDKASTSLNNSVVSISSEIVDHGPANQGNMNPNLCLNETAPSIPSLLEVCLPNFSQQDYEENSTSAAGSSNMTRKQKRKSNKFQFPNEDFIPISNDEVNKASPRCKKRNRKQLAINPMHNLGKFNPRVPETTDNLAKRASSILNQAIQLNVPKVMKAGLRMEKMMKENKLKWKHIHHLNRLINSHQILQRRGVR